MRTAHFPVSAHDDLGIVGRLRVSPCVHHVRLSVLRAPVYRDVDRAAPVHRIHNGVRVRDRPRFRVPLPHVPASRETCYDHQAAEWEGSENDTRRQGRGGMVSARAPVCDPRTVFHAPILRTIPPTATRRVLPSAPMKYLALASLLTLAACSDPLPAPDATTDAQVDAASPSDTTDAPLVLDASID